MSDQLAKPLTGQYSFPKTADLSATLRNLRIGGTSHTLTVANSATTANAALYSVFNVSTSGTVVVTVSNLLDGQEIVILVNAVGNSLDLTISPNAGDDPAALVDGGSSIVRVRKFGSVVYVTSQAVVTP